jgi:hypothetical protein
MTQLMIDHLSSGIRDFFVRQIRDDKPKIHREDGQATRLPLGTILELI